MKNHYLARINDMWVCNVYESIPKIHLSGEKEDGIALTFEQAEWVKKTIGASIVRVTVSEEEL